MKTAFTGNGYSMLAMVILIMLIGFAAVEFRHSEAFRQSLHLQQKARETQILEQLRASLLGFAASQGLHSQSHLGHLPCPAFKPGEYAQTSCLNKLWGYLPVQSRIAVNYLNPGVDAQFNELDVSTNTQWQYAVSSQLVQPNALGWGRWVNYAQPSIQVRIPNENNHIQTGIAAVVAKTITPTSEHQYDISPPYMLVQVSELQSHMKQVQSNQLKNTLNAWKQLNTKFQPDNGSHENIIPDGQVAHVYQPIDSDCKCRCTRTRCSCHCRDSGQWTSPATCTDNNPNCMAGSDTQTDCTSHAANEPCVFNGPASLKNLWPVSHFEPVAAANKACRPTRANECPLSVNNTACTCHFSWPDNTLSSLDQFRFKLPAAQ